MVVGLGNPGAQYRDTRHNAGAMLVDRLARNGRQEWRNEPKFFSHMAEVRLGGSKVLLCKPQTYMNLSGEAVGKVSRFFRVNARQVYVAVDDADLPLGMLRVKPSGGTGGHHGLESVQEHLGTQDFPRLRLGIARPDQSVRDIANHVLGNFTEAERDHFERVLERAEQMLASAFRESLQKAMSLYNGRVE